MRFRRTALSAPWGRSPRAPRRRFRFRATLDTLGNFCFLGTAASSALLFDGTAWGGPGGYADSPGFVASNVGDDLPFTVWQTSKDDPLPPWQDQIDAAAAFESARRGYAVCWFMGLHDTLAPTRGLIDRDWSGADTSIAYNKAKFALNTPYPAFSNSSINDAMGSARDGVGLFDGDHNGCKNAGF